ncbi:uncharacterized protein LACBIDRAFT_333151 [Laccaria bicolor S238N-H82]|uniref:Predicted protein n=1 Tax=Laccaria bicolor (strain S238N-H82 / ATCC MYA-4686) TaxID=486041 RepID=B0DV23_LACBS|nr:uncharacterized protein LACBIDRAFT_333151 [Laccaria bicolor S238N-H82]EDR01502.1 predicted protein [Laccaria bicolor S238N-H82]|eukprot:XP_001887854.1 predicted protein [Laccaria bicolor S238N-H82]
MFRFMTRYKQAANPRLGCASRPVMRCVEDLDEVDVPTIREVLTCDLLVTDILSNSSLKRLYYTSFGRRWAQLERIRWRCKVQYLNANILGGVINDRPSIMNFEIPSSKVARERFSTSHLANMSSIGEIIAELKELTAYVGAMRLVTYFDVAGAAMFLYDYFLTVGMEVDLVWSSKWGFMKVLYILQRYLPFVDAAILCFLHQFSTTISPSTCSVVEKLRGLILTLRAWAVWRRDGRLGTALSILFVATVSFPARFTIPYPEFQGCFITGSNRMVYINWVILMIYEADRRGEDASFHAVVYRDVLSTINVVVVTSLSENYLDMLSSVERCLHSMLTSRVVLNIRDYVRNARPGWSDGVTEIQVNSGVIRHRKTNSTDNPDNVIP